MHDEDRHNEADTGQRSDAESTGEAQEEPEDQDVERCICGPRQLKSGQARSGHVRSGQVRPGQVRSCYVRSYQVRSGQVRSGQVRSGQVTSGLACHVMSGQVMSGLVMWCQVRSGQVRSSQVKRTRTLSGASVGRRSATLARQHKGGGIVVCACRYARMYMACAPCICTAWQGKGGWYGGGKGQRPEPLSQIQQSMWKRVKDQLQVSVGDFSRSATCTRACGRGQCSSRHVCT